MITIYIDEKVIDEHNSVNLQIIKTIYKIKNDRLVIFLRGSVRCGFLTETCGGRKPHLLLPSSAQRSKGKFVLYKKIRM